jgi:hypothetical protein
MSYCSSLEGDVYMYPSDAGIVCCACALAPKVPTIFTKGTRADHPLWPNTPPCQACAGAGCDQCMLHGSQYFQTAQDAYEHLVSHRQAGHGVPQRAFDELIEEGATLFEDRPSGA